MENIIKISGLTKIYNAGKYNQVNALNGIDLEVGKGKIIAVMGVSGSGKSTLLNILGCLDRPSAGIYFVDGNDVSKMSASKLAALRGGKFGFILQENALLGKESVYENVKIPLIFSDKYKRSQHKKRINEVLKTLGIFDLVKRKVSQLSGGQRQRVAIARSIINDPEIILADDLPAR